MEIPNIRSACDGESNTVYDWKLCVGGAVYSQLKESTFYVSGFIRTTAMSAVIT